jgi:hypothetical protein
LALAFLDLAKTIGYRAVFFNLVRDAVTTATTRFSYATRSLCPTCRLSSSGGPSVRLDTDPLTGELPLAGFKETGRVPRAGLLRSEDGSEQYIDASQFYYDLTAHTGTA